MLLLKHCKICDKKFKTYRISAKYCSQFCKNEVQKVRMEGKNNPFWGKNHTKETKERLRLLNIGKKHPEQTKQKIRETMIGKKMSEETKRKISSANIGHINGMKGKKHSDETKLKISLKNKGRKMSLEQKIKLSRLWKNTKKSSQIRLKMGLKGEKNHFWKGGITPINARIRNSVMYKLWRESVFKRDNFTCQECNSLGGYLNADHIKPFAYFPELRFEINNGRTLCLKCHKQTNTFGKKAIKLYGKKQITPTL